MVKFAKYLYYLYGIKSLLQDIHLIHTNLIGDAFVGPPMNGFLIVSDSD